MAHWPRRFQRRLHNDPQGALTNAVSIDLKELLFPTRVTGNNGTASTAAFKKSLRMEQHKTKLTADVTVSDKLSIVNVWLFRDTGEWYVLSSAARDIGAGSAALAIELAEVSSLLVAESSRSSEDLRHTEENKGRMTFYLEVTGPSDAISETARQQAVANGCGQEPAAEGTQRGGAEYPAVVHGLVPLGRFHHTEIPTFTSVEIDGNTVTPYVTKKGNIAVAVNNDLRPFMRVHVDEVTVGDSRRVLLNGRVYTRHSSISELHLQLAARTAEHTITVPATLIFNQEETEQRFGLNRYWFTAELPLSEFLALDGRADDIFDTWLTAAMAGREERHRVRVGKNRYLVRRKAAPGTAAVGESAVSVVPYFTMKAKNISFQVEYFDRRALQLIDSAISRPRKFRSIARQAFSDRPVWLVGEMPFKAQDTGLSLFKYLIDNHPEIDARYVIDLDSPELSNLVGYEEHVVRHRSEEHVLLSLAASRIIGSHHPDYIYPTRRKEFVKACRGLEVFLQHGVMGMKWMTQTYGKDASGFSTDLFLTSSEREKKMIVEDFGYSPAEVEVTGLSRFDALFDDDVRVRPNQVLILPTWRDWLTTTDSFEETKFFEEWHGFLNSPELLDLCRRFDLDIVFGLHPNMRHHIEKFSNSPARIFVQGEVNVQTLIKQSGIMITDYSSAGLDFSFLHKPLLYFQFDRTRFFGKSGSHFDLERELPGPVCWSRNGLLRQLERLITAGEQSFSEYFARADLLYPFRDQNNRERIVQAVLTASPRSTLDNVTHSEPVQLLQKRLRRSKHYFPAMKRMFSAAKKLPMLDDVIVFESGLGRQFADSPRKIYEELVRRGDGRTKVWVYDKKLPTVDPHTLVVKRLSPQYFWYLARAKHWVNNQNFPYYITRRKNGVYLQTWHGTPLKRMQHDLDRIEGRDAGYLDRVTQASAQWSYLLSPSPYATAAFSTAFRHDAAIIEKGYPRNDVLSSPNLQELREEVRLKLDLPEGKKVLLYAPTFRDDQNISGNRFAFTLPFDLESFAAEFGDDYVLLLRMHVVVRSKITIPDHLTDVIRNVSAHDDINELYLVSDALITDYSSVFFDYSILQRPIIFYAYDLEKYRDQLRGFYLDYEADLPGPIVTSQSELWDTLTTLDRQSPELSARSSAFAAEYAPHDDGRAASRVVDEVFFTEQTDK